MTYIGRFLIILAGYVAAVLAASAMFHLLVLPVFGFAVEELEPVSAALKLSIPVVALFVAFYAFVPAMALIALAELFGWRSWLYFGSAGALLGIGLGAAGPAGDGPMFGSTLLAIITGCGVAGGLAYWLFAGRSSGRRDAAP